MRTPLPAMPLRRPRSADRSVRISLDGARLAVTGSGDACLPLGPRGFFVRPSSDFARPTRDVPIYFLLYHHIPTCQGCFWDFFKIFKINPKRGKLKPPQTSFEAVFR
jgi:hypothetical protein